MILPASIGSMNLKHLKELAEAGERLKLTAGQEGIEARAESTIVALASLNADGKPVSLATINAAIDRYLEIASDKFMQECALDCLGQAAARRITAATIRSRFWNNVWGLIARRQLVVMGKRRSRKI